MKKFKELIVKCNNREDAIARLVEVGEKCQRPPFGYSEEIEKLYDQNDKLYHPEADGGISIVDDSLGIDWRIPVEKALLSEKDAQHSLLCDFDSPFSIDIDIYPKF